MRIAGTAKAFPSIRSFVQLEWIFEARDLWIGVYWKRYPKALEVYLCILPVLPVRFYVQWGM